MCFTDFEQSIKSPSLRRIAHHWNEARGSLAMPSWSDIRPSRIASQLSIIWSYRYDRSREVFIGRLAGDRVESVLGKTFRNAPMTELYPADQFPIMYGRFRRVVCEPALYLEEGKVFQFADRYGFGERIALPLASDGSGGDGVVGATAYEAYGITDAQPAPDKENWFPL